MQVGARDCSTCGRLSRGEVGSMVSNDRETPTLAEEAISAILVTQFSCRFVRPSWNNEIAAQIRTSDIETLIFLTVCNFPSTSSVSCRAEAVALVALAELISAHELISGKAMSFLFSFHLDLSINDGILIISSYS